MIVVNKETEDQFFGILAEIAQTNTHHIDGQMISNILKLCYLCGLKRGELIRLKIQDVTDKGGIALGKIKVGNNERIISNTAKRFIALK